jgi:DNA-binding IscR family transcriptional regulator
MNYNTLEQTVKELAEPAEIDILSIYRALEQVEDERHKRGVRYSVALVLTLVLLGKAAGMTTLAAIAKWCACEPTVWETFFP